MSQLSFGKLILEDLKTHDNDWTRPGFQALAVYRFGEWRAKLKPKVLRAPFSLLYKLLFLFVRNFYGIEIPYATKVGRRVKFEHQHGIVIHGNSTIGDDCIIRHGVTLGMKRESSAFEAPTLGRRVSVGAGAKILGKINIGDDAVIGANCVVTKDVAAGEIVRNRNS